MENSIKEDMKILEGIIKGDEDCINAIYSQMKVKNDNDEDIQYYKKEIQSIKNIVDNYLKEKARADKLEKEYSAMLTELDENECDYKRVLKENEELKQDRNNNYQMIALSQNEMLGYIQGYEDGKKLRKNAVANIVENQQYYILNKQIEKYKECIEKLQKDNEELKSNNEKYIIHLTDEQYKTVIEIAQNDINQKWIQKVKDKIEHYQKLQDNYIEKYDEINEGLQAMINALQELLEGRK